VAVAALAWLWPASSSPTDSPTATAAPPAHVHRRGPDGSLPAGTSVFDDNAPGVARLDADLLGALRRAATDAGPVRFVVDSGWRSPAYQERLLQQAVAKYGSEAEAARWVATPETSEHVKGAAADMGSASAAWLAEHGAAYGLCRVYGNEPWHFELRPDAATHGCPPMYADPTHDPRMQP
jgi:LAS superfamily LD-carboxypeptidase LdcB